MRNLSIDLWDVKGCSGFNPLKDVNAMVLLSHDILDLLSHYNPVDEKMNVICEGWHNMRCHLQMILNAPLISLDDHKFRKHMDSFVGDASWRHRHAHWDVTGDSLLRKVSSDEDTRHYLRFYCGWKVNY